MGVFLLLNPSMDLVLCLRACIVLLLLSRNLIWGCLLSIGFFLGFLCRCKNLTFNVYP